MGKQWARQQSNRNEIAEGVGTAVGWIAANRTLAQGLAGGALAALILAGLAWARLSIVRREAWEKLAIAQSYAYQGQMQPAQEQLKALMEGSGMASEFAALFAGDLEFKQAHYKEAAQVYQRVVDRGGPKNILPMAMADLGLSQEAAGDCKASVEVNQRFVDTYQDHFLAPQTHASLARCLYLLGQSQQAKSTLDRMVLLYPDSYWAQWAKERLNPAPPPPAAKK